MHKLDGKNTTATMPAMGAVGGSPGWAKAEGATPPTQLTGEWVNAIQAEIINLIENQGITLDKADSAQLYQAVVAPILSGIVGIGAATTLHTAAAIVCANAVVGSGDPSLAAASRQVGVDGDCSAAIACNFSSDGGSVEGDSCAAIACDTSAVTVSIGGVGCAALASRDPEVVGLFSASVASSAGVINCISAAMLGSADSKIRSAHGGTAPQNVVMLASRFCDFDLGANGSAQRQYAVAGGYHASVLTAPSWRIESNGGTMRSTAAHTTSGLDYAEMFPTLDGEIPIARIVTGKGRGVRLAQPGDRVRGTVSVSPSVIGGDDGIAWNGRYLRDEYGRVMTEDVEVARDEIDPESAALYAARKATIKEALAKCVDPVSPVAANALGPRTTKRRVSNGVAFADSVDQRRLDREAYADAMDAWERAKKAVRMKRTALAVALKDLPKPTRVTVVDVVTQSAINPKWDPSRAQVSRRDRPAEWACIALTGQVPVEVDASVQPGGFVAPAADGRGTHSDEPGKGRAIECLEILSPFDEARGFAIALCLVG